MYIHMETDFRPLYVTIDTVGSPMGKGCISIKRSFIVVPTRRGRRQFCECLVEINISRQR